MDARAPVRAWRLGAARWLWALIALLVMMGAPASAQSSAPYRLDRGRFTVVSYPRDAVLARSILDAALARDTFPGLPRPREHVLVAIAPDAATFREWAGPRAPEWGAALAFPGERRVLLQGSAAGADAGDPIEVLRHELAHLALHEYLGDLAPRWFDEGYASYAAHEQTRNDAFAANLALAVGGVPTFDQLEGYFDQGTTTAQAGYALATNAVADLAGLDPQHGLARVFEEWKATGSLDQALRRTEYTTLDGFEAGWRKRAQRRYGALALMEDLTLLGILFAVFALPLWLARRKRDRERMAALVAADAAEDKALRESMLAELLGPGPAPAEREGNEPDANRP